MKFSFTRIWYAVVRVAYLEVFFILSTCPISLTTFSTWDLAVDDTVDGKDNKKEKTRKVPDIRMYHISWNFLQLGRDMLWWWWLTWKLFLLSTCLTTLSTCGLVFDGTVDGNDNKEEKTREVANTRMYYFGRNFLQLGHDMLWWLWLTWKFFYTFILSDYI